MRALIGLTCCALAAACSKPAPAAPDAAVAEKPVELTLLFTGAENGYLLPTADEAGVLHGGSAEVLGRWVTNEGHCAGPVNDREPSPCQDPRTLALSTGDNANGAA